VLLDVYTTALLDVSDRQHETSGVVCYGIMKPPKCVHNTFGGFATTILVTLLAFLGAGALITVLEP
jgi:hypothetical protein